MNRDDLLSPEEIAQLDEETQRQYLAKLRNLQIAMAKENPVVLGSVCADPLIFKYPITPFQTEWMDALQKYRMVVILAPRGHGKSKWLSTVYPCWRLGNDPQLRIIIASKTDGMAERPLRDCDILLSSPEYQSVFGDLTDKKGKWTNDEKVLKRKPMKDPSLKSTGAASGVVGSRADIIIFDDIIDDENTQTEHLRTKLRNWFWRTMIPILETEEEVWKGQIIVGGTRWHWQDVYGELLDQFMGEDESFVKVYMVDQPGGQLLWPEKERMVEQRRRQLPPIDFACQFNNDPSGSSGTILKVEWLHYADEAFIKEAKDWPLYYGVDPSLTKDERSDWTCIAKFRALGDKAYFQELIYKKCDGPDVISLIKEHAYIDNPRKILIESNAAQVIIAQHLERTSGLRVERAYSMKAKELRFKAMSSHFANGNVLLNPDKDSGIEYFKQCWIGFDREKDDPLDAAEFGLQAAGLTSGAKVTPIYRPKLSRRVGIPF